MTFDQVYKNAISHTFNAGILQHNERTNTDIIATHGYSFRWNMQNWPVTIARPMYAKTGAAEIAWMLSGEKSATWINKHTKIWKAFADDHNMIETAYGNRWRYAFGVDQIQNIIKKLKVDPTSRQQVLLSWDARVDNVKSAPNIPCPYTAVFNIINNKLNCHLTLRSNDVYLGLPYDVLMYTLLSNALAKSLGVDIGELFYSIAHMHLYENQFKAARYIEQKDHHGEYRVIELNWPVNRILDDQDGYVAAAIADLKATNYQPEIGPAKVKVVL